MKHKVVQCIGFVATCSLLLALLAPGAGADDVPVAAPSSHEASAPETTPSPPASPPPGLAVGNLTFEWHGSAYLWLYAPLIDGAKADLSLYFASLVLDAKYKPFDLQGTAVATGFHFEPRFRDTKLRSYFGSNVWVQEAYGHADAGRLVVKVGKVYTRFGRFWDNSFYGNLPYFDGLKLSPDIGVSAEIAQLARGPLQFNIYAQYFVNDGVTNGSLPARDTVSVPGARKRNEIVGRVESTYAISPDTSVSLGLSAQHFQADLPPPVGEQAVTRLGVDVNVSPVKGLSLYADYAWQRGKHVIDYPAMGAASSRTHYLLAGAEYATSGPVTARFNLSYVDYSGPGVTEIVYQPGIVLKVHDHMSIIGEYVYWNQDQASTTTRVDHSLNFILYASF